jgi:hypothetical protein
MGGTRCIRKAVIGITNTLRRKRVTIAGHPGDDLAPGTLNSVFKQAGIKKSGKR